MRKVSVRRHFAGNGGVFRPVAHGPSDLHTCVFISHDHFSFQATFGNREVSHKKRALPALALHLNLAVVGRSSWSKWASPLSPRPTRSAPCTVPPPCPRRQLRPPLGCGAQPVLEEEA